MDWLDRANTSLGLTDGSYAKMGMRAGAAAGPLGMGLGYLAGLLMDRRGNANLTDSMDRNLGNTIDRNNAAIWAPYSESGTPSPNYVMQDQPQPTDDAPSPLLESLGITSYGGGGGGGLGGSGGGLSAGSSLPGGGFDGVMNGASGNMMTDFAATTNGDYMQRLQSHNGQQGSNVQAKKR